MHLPYAFKQAVLYRSAVEEKEEKMRKIKGGKIAKKEASYRPIEFCRLLQDWKGCASASIIGFFLSCVHSLNPGPVFLTFFWPKGRPQSMKHYGIKADLLLLFITRVLFITIII